MKPQKRKGTESKCKEEKYTVVSYMNDIEGDQAELHLLPTVGSTQISLE
jgi:hypothetical protein